MLSENSSRRQPSHSKKNVQMPTPKDSKKRKSRQWVKNWSRRWSARRATRRQTSLRAKVLLPASLMKKRRQSVIFASRFPCCCVLLFFLLVFKYKYVSWNTIDWQIRIIRISWEGQSTSWWVSEWVIDQIWIPWKYQKYPHPYHPWDLELGYSSTPKNRFNLSDYKVEIPSFLSGI